MKQCELCDYVTSVRWATFRGVRQMFVVVLLLAGCPAEEPPACKAVNTSCQPGYLPTFDNVFANTLEQKCGMGSSCHSSIGKAGNLVLDDQATAYQQLMLEGRVKPMDPGCSEMIVRTDSPGHDYQMPPGDPLSEPERCALVQWVQLGATNP